MSDIRDLPVPKLLVQLIADGRWRHPSNHIIRRAVPVISDPLDFLPSLEVMDLESRTFIADDPEYSSFFHEYRGNTSADHPDLPWLDIDRAFFIAINKIPGDDVAIALDFRTCENDPRVVASEWDDHGCWWREIAPTFSEFVRLIEL